MIMRDSNRPELDFLCDVNGCESSMNETRFSHVEKPLPAIAQMKEVEADITSNRDKSIYKMKMKHR